MSDDVKQLLDRALPNAWDATGASSDTAITAGTALRRRRRVAAGAVTAMGIGALALATVVALPGAAESPEPYKDTPADGAESAPYALPDLDLDADYYWASADPEDPGDRETAEAYELAIGEHLAAELPDVAAYSQGERLDDWKPMVSSDHRGLWRDENGDGIGDSGGNDPADEQVHAQPIYELSYINGDGGGRLGTGDEDELALQVYPVDGFMTGPGESIVHLASCEPSEEEIQAGQTLTTTPECSDETGPNGETVLNVVGAQETNPGSHKTEKLTTVLYRTDGSAVVVSNTSGPDADARLDFDQLLDLALSLPMSPVQ